MRILFIGGGAGILLANMFAGVKNPWRKVFNFILIIAGSLLSVFLFRTGDIDGLCIYGSLVAVVTISTIFPVGGLAGFSLYLTFLAISGRTDAAFRNA